MKNRLNERISRRRTGKEKRVQITPESHIEMINKVTELAERFTKAREKICDY